ncbi:hypothetical protein [Flavobacterium branchiicola]|uniref:Uncharacterized protein n=1 Tax=Flavobacterium branchiicola TaxID=1114875 RepID=A0ABV9P8J9_9FLAO|nr:hypothetical protein [Flavobacterium branchiicola]MBS7253618.1 hypothetical protein [Flavobacterium branchiicola]
MKQKIMLLILMTVSLSSYAQTGTGINTKNPQGVLHIDGAKDNPAAGVPSAAQQANDVIASAEGNVGVGTTAPTARVELRGTTTVPPIKVINIGGSNSANNVDNNTLVPVMIDEDGIMMKQYTPVLFENSYALNSDFYFASGASRTIFTGVSSSTIVLFEFHTNYAFGNSNTSILYGSISFSVKNGFKVGDWSFSGNGATTGASLSGLGTNTLTFNYISGADLIFQYSAGVITVRKSVSGTFNMYVYNGKKIR